MLRESVLTLPSYIINLMSYNLTALSCQAEVYHENKVVCLREISVFIGSGRLQNWINRLEVARNGHSRGADELPKPV